jgi:alpha-1,6-mannosyltransferase
MKILDITEFYSERGGGVRSHLTTKSHILCQLGHEHVIVAPGAENIELPGLPTGVSAGHRYGGKSRLIRVRGPAAPYDPSYHLIVGTRAIKRIIARERPDVLEIHSPYLAALSALSADREMYGIRTFQWHSDFIDTYAGVLGNKIKALPSHAISSATTPLWSWVRAIARRCDATLVASKWQAEKLEAHAVPNVRLRPFGIEREVFRPEARSEHARDALLALAGRRTEASRGTAVLVGVGRFAIEKRWEVVLDAFAELRARGHDAVLILFGDGPERSRMQARIPLSYARDVAMPGFTKDRAELARSLASADLLVHACPFETFGLSIAEALSCGLPAVVPDEGGASEMHSPSSGERYRAGDKTACVGAVERVLQRIQSDRNALRRAARDHAATLPDVRGQFEAQLGIYHELLDTKQSALPR